MPSSAEERLEAFREINAKQRLSWDKRLEIIKDQFPAVEKLKWKAAFDNDLDMFASIMRDILKVDQAVPGRPGPRPALDRDQGYRSLAQLMGEDYSTLAFPQAFEVLAGSRSLSHVARLTGISRSQTHRLLRGEVEPDAHEMTVIAKAFGKHPSFFAEYRAGYVTAHVNARLIDCPEASIGLYRRMTEMD